MINKKKNQINKIIDIYFIIKIIKYNIKCIQFNIFQDNNVIEKKESLDSNKTIIDLKKKKNCKFQNFFQITIFFFFN